MGLRSTQLHAFAASWMVDGVEQHNESARMRSRCSVLQCARITRGVRCPDEQARMLQGSASKSRSPHCFSGQAVQTARMNCHHLLTIFKPCCLGRDWDMLCTRKIQLRLRRTTRLRRRKRLTTFANWCGWHGWRASGGTTPRGSLWRCITMPMQQPRKSKGANQSVAAAMSSRTSYCHSLHYYCHIRV